MLIELAVGDAYGAGFEYVRDHKFIRRFNTLDEYVKHPRHKRKPGRYTDDTQMSLAIAELLVSGLDWTPKNIADKFVEVFKRERPLREGYSGAFFKFLKKVADGREFLDNINSKSDKSGAAMRAVPLGIFSSTDEVIEKSTIQAKLTHNTTDGINAAVAASLISHFFIYGHGKKDQLGTFLESHVPGKWSEPWRGEVGSRGWMSVRAAITVIRQNDSMRKLLKNCVSFSGDVDTVAAIAMAGGSCSREIAQDIPPALIKRLENREYGRDYIDSLDKKLMGLIRMPAPLWQTTHRR